MNITLNIPVRLMVRLLRAVERIANDYATVHASELSAARTPPSPGDRGRVWQQSDRALWEAERKEKQGEMYEA